MAVALRKPSAERRREIGAAALRIAGRDGVTALTTSKLAREVGVSTGALFRHFESLDDVLREAARRGLETLESTFPDRSLPPLARIAALARNRVALLSRDPGLAWLVRSDQAVLLLPGDATESLQQLVSRSRRFLLEALREGARDGSIRDDIEPETLLVVISGAIHALVGMPGVHRLARAPRAAPPEAVLADLLRLLAPATPKEKSK
jgi:AcrR family transcriptional regulator